MKRVIPIIALLLSGCANQQYAGINYGEVVTPDGEHWIIAGGKDEQNVSFEVVRPDGTTARYSAENADASTVIKAMADANARMVETVAGILQRLAPPVAP